jgi:hypothetical protein
MKIKMLSFALAACFLASNANAQTYHLNSSFSNVWQVPEVTINAPGLENAWVIIMPLAGTDGSQYFNVDIGRDGQDDTDYYTFHFPKNIKPRRFVVELKKLYPDVHDVQVMSLNINCPWKCSALVVMRPSGPDFWRPVFAPALSINEADLFQTEDK